jgi:hypothetical protein
MWLPNYLDPVAKKSSMSLNGTKTSAPGVLTRTVEESTNPAKVPIADCARSIKLPSDTTASQSALEISFGLVTPLRRPSIFMINGGSGFA